MKIIRTLLIILCSLSLQLSALTVTSSSSSSSSSSFGPIKATASASAFARATVFGTGNNWWGSFWATGGYWGGGPGYDGFGWSYYGNMVNPGYGGEFDTMPREVDRTPGYSYWRLPNTYFNYQKNNLKHYLQSEQAPDEPSKMPH